MSTSALLEDWSVELYRNDRLVHTAAHRRERRLPDQRHRAELRDGGSLRAALLAPGAGANTAKLGRAHSIFTNDLQRITDIVVQPGSNLQNLNLPIEPNGVVYNTIARTPIAGATLTMLNAGSRSALPAELLRRSGAAEPGHAARTATTGSTSTSPIRRARAAAATSSRSTAPATGYIAGPSQIIPPTSDASTAPFSVPTCPGSADDAVPATAQHCEVQTSEFAPPPSVRARTPGTRYHLHLTLDDSLVPGSSQIFNNHIPLDPDLQGVLSITKTTPMLNVTRGQLVPYTITYSNITRGAAVRRRARRSLPGGLPLRRRLGAHRRRAGRADARGPRAHLERSRPSTATARTLDRAAARGRRRRGRGRVRESRAGGARADRATRCRAKATATVRVMPDATFDCTDVTGKVFDDANRNGYQDEGEQRPVRRARGDARAA